MLLRNPYIVDPQKEEIFQSDIRIVNGRIAEIGRQLSPDPNENVLDLDDLYVSPGLIDTHVHFRDPGFTWKEDLHTG